MDLSQLDDFTLSLLTNDEVLAVNQDEQGSPARKVDEGEGWQVWAKPLADGSVAAGLFHTGIGSLVEAFSWDGQFSGVFATEVPYHGVVLVRIR
jgi:alpha-galactosidase